MRETRVPPDRAGRRESPNVTTVTDATDRTEPDEFTLFALGVVVLRRRRLILLLALTGALLGAIAGLRQPREYVSSATFVPQESGDASGLSQAVAQLGLHPASNSGSWGPPVYVELMHSRPILERLAIDTLQVTEMGGKRIPIMDVLEVSDPLPARRLQLAVESLRGKVEASEQRALSAVRLDVTTRWPSVSLALAQRLVARINEFNIETRKSQAAAERQFAETQSLDAERALRQAEDRMQSFLQQNHGSSSSPELAFQRDRLQRDVTLRQQSYTTLLLSANEARLREVRDTPLITVLEEPRLPLAPESRNVAVRTLLGGLGGAAIAVLVAFLLNALASAREKDAPRSREFFRLLHEMTPRPLRRRAR
jgi:tyrosine-protein kinase Etk/Wzc